jgi:DNA topoisomerase-1
MTLASVEPSLALPPPVVAPALRDKREDRKRLVRAARRAHLTLADADALTITRRRMGSGFAYFDADGRRIEDEATRERIRALAIPPAYREVRIAHDPRAHVQAIGLDEAGRSQHRYHPDWEIVREARKAERLRRVIEVLPRIRSQVERDLASRRYDKAKAVACAVALIDNSHIRVGCEAYARDNGSHGAATLLKRHVRIEGAAITLAFRGKGGKDISCAIEDKRLAAALKDVARIPGKRLLQYLDVDARPHPINASDVNAYLHAVTGVDVTAKDFRMLGASAAAAETLAGIEPARTEGGRKRQLAAVMKAVAERLANTPAVVRKSYVHALVVRSFQTGALAKAHRVARSGHKRRRVEAALGRLVARMTRG